MIKIDSCSGASYTLSPGFSETKQPISIVHLRNNTCAIHRASHTNLRHLRTKPI